MEAARNSPRRGALTGLAVTGSVITSAGAVLAGTFAVLGTLPVTFLTEIGFAVAFGVLLDTIVVRSVLVTALNLDLGRWMWWPGKLARETARPGLELEAAGDRVRSYARGSSALDENAAIGVAERGCAGDVGSDLVALDHPSRSPADACTRDA